MTQAQTSLASQLKQVFMVNGVAYETRAEAEDAIRLPLVKAALLKLTGDNEELATFLAERRDDLDAIFDTGTIRRVSKSERNKLRKAVEAVVAAGNKEFAFLIEHADVVVDSFKWPAQARLKPEDKIVEVNAKLMELTEGNQGVVDWLITNKEAVFEAFEAGKVKRPVNERAKEGLAAWRAKQAERKEELEKAKAESAEAYEAVVARHKQEDEDEAARKAALAEAAKGAAE